MTPTSSDAEAILRTITSWSTRDRLLLAQRILDQVLTSDHSGVRARWQELAGLAAPDGPVPDDADVAVWLEEHRLERYG